MGPSLACVLDELRVDYTVAQGAIGPVGLRLILETTSLGKSGDWHNGNEGVLHTL